MTLPSYEKLGVFYLGREYDPKSQALGDEPALRLPGPDDPRRLHRHDRQRQDRALPVAARGGRHRRRAGHRHRPQGRHRQPAAHVSGPAAGGLPALGGRRRGRRARASRSRISRRQRPRPGARDSPSGTRTARASSACATRPRSRSTRRARTPAGRCRSCARSPRRTRPRSSDATALKERIGSAVAGLLGLLGIDADPIRSREHILLSAILDTALAQGPEPRPRGDHPGRAEAAVRQGRRLRRRELLSRRRTAWSSRCASTACSPRQASRPGSKARRSTSRSCSSPPRASRASSIISIAHLNDAERMFVVTLVRTNSWRGCAGSRARPACARSSTWTRCSATSRRRRCRLPSCRCSR